MYGSAVDEWKNTVLGVGEAMKQVCFGPIGIKNSAYCNKMTRMHSLLALYRKDLHWSLRRHVRGSIHCPNFPSFPSTRFSFNTFSWDNRCFRRSDSWSCAPPKPEDGRGTRRPQSCDDHRVRDHFSITYCMGLTLGIIEPWVNSLIGLEWKSSPLVKSGDQLWLIKTGLEVNDFNCERMTSWGFHWYLRSWIWVE